MTVYDKVYRAISYGAVSFEEGMRQLEKVKNCDCEFLTIVKTGEEAKELECNDCGKPWFGCAYEGCKHPVDFETVEEVHAHVADRHFIEEEAV